MKCFHVLILCCCFSWSMPALAQTVEDTAGRVDTANILAKKKLFSELDFISYCQGRNQYTDALYLLRKLYPVYSQQVEFADTLNYSLGWTHYSLKNLDSSAVFFQKVSPASSQYFKSRFFASWNELYLRKDEKASKILRDISVPEAQREEWAELVGELIAFQASGIALLQRDYPRFDSLSSTFTHAYYTLATEQSNLLAYRKLIQDFKHKRMWQAAFMSAIIPGSGKIYAGKKGEGIAAFLVTASLGLIGWENYHKAGPTNWKTMLSGGIFTIYYLGNIWGSAFAAQRYNEAFNTTINNRVLFDLHIPLRNIFN